MNVDGISLDASNGYQANNLEVRNKDSIRVFVEMTSPINSATTPQQLRIISSLRLRVVYNRR